MYEPRFYRNWSKSDDLISFEAKVRETDLFICAAKNLKNEALESILRHRASVEKYIEKNPVFLTTLNPVKVENGAPEIIREMANASAKVVVGPMASVAGAIAEFVGKDLLKYSSEVIVENGGDIFIKTSKKRFIGIYAGRSKFTGKIALEISGDETPLGVCTSSGTVGHSLSFGNANAVVVLSNCTFLADATATAIGNLIKEEKDIPEGIEFAKSINEIKGVVIIKNDKIGIWGHIVKISSSW
ncbi:MAG: hypothetical protein C0412_14590 [Flavobacterium sp.]|nr:hypothetical protein [Flavobacterium sp.]